MSWIIAGSAAGTALVGAYSQHQQAAAQQRNKKAEMLANASQIQFSPWTGMKSNVEGNTAPDPTAAGLGGAVQGGVTGAMMGSQIRSQFNKPTPPDNPVPPNQPNQYLGNYTFQTGLPQR